MASATHIARLVEREALVLRRLWQGVAFSAFVQPVLYLVAMGVGVGSYVDRQGSASLGGLSFLQFVTPGLLAASVFQLAVSESLWWVMGGSTWDKRYLAMVASPLTAEDVFGGHLVWEAIRAVITTAAFLVVAVTLGGISSAWALLAPLVAVLLAVAVAAPAAAWSSTATSDASFTIILRLGVMPLFLFSGTFFPTSNLPGWLRPAVVLSPLYHAVELMRAATTGRSPGAGPLLAHVAFLLALAAVGWRAGRRAFTTRLAP